MDVDGAISDGRDARTGRFQKGHKRITGSGRPPPETGLTIKQAVLDAFKQAGGTEYLLKLARGTQQDRNTFANLCSKLIPTEITGDIRHALEVIVVEREKPVPAIEHVAEPQITYEANE